MVQGFIIKRWVLGMDFKFQKKKKKILKFSKQKEDILVILFLRAIFVIKTKKKAI